MPACRRSAKLRMVWRRAIARDAASRSPRRRAGPLGGAGAAPPPRRPLASMCANSGANGRAALATTLRERLLGSARRCGGPPRAGARGDHPRVAQGPVAGLSVHAAAASATVIGAEEPPGQRQAHRGPRAVSSSKTGLASPQANSASGAIFARAFLASTARSPRKSGRAARLAHSRLPLGHHLRRGAVRSHPASAAWPGLRLRGHEELVERPLAEDVEVLRVQVQLGGEALAALGEVARTRRRCARVRASRAIR